MLNLYLSLIVAVVAPASAVTMLVAGAHPVGVVTLAERLPSVGLAIVENNGQIVSTETADRAMCNGDSVELTVTSGGIPLDLGRTRRFFSGRQREALAVRDGGCLWPDCDKPPSWTEAHHIRQWKRDHGKTNLVDGVLLCRYHHLTLHNNHWEITRRRDGYWLVPPPGGQRTPRDPVLLRSKSPLIERLGRRDVG